MKIQTENNRIFFKVAMVLMASFLVWFFAQSYSHAAIAKQISYQGKLTNTADVAVADGSYSMVFSIYTAASGGTPVWTASRTVSISKGLFSVMLGDTTAGDPALNLDFNAAYFLGVKIEDDLEMSPRKTVGAAAYAFNSDLLDGLDAKTSGADAHIVATDTSGNLMVSGNTYFANGTTYNVDGSGNATLNALALASGNVTATGAMTLTPAAGTNLNVSLSGNGDLAINANQLYVDTSTGNVGIGTNAPSTAMHLKTAVDGPETLTIENTNATGVSASSTVRVLGDTASTYLIAHGSGRTIQRYGITLGGYSELLTNVGNGLIIGTSVAKPLIFGTNNVERFRIDENGNIGMGTTTPAYYANPGRLYLTLKGSTTNGVLEFVTGQTDADAVSNGLIQFVDINTPNGTGVDKRSAAIQGYLQGSIANYRGGMLVFTTRTDGVAKLSERMRITNAGTIGLGTMAPVAKVHIKNSFPVTSVTTGLNDLAAGTTYTGSTAATFNVKIVSTGSPNQFQWRKDGGAWSGNVSITGGAQTLQDGLTVTFTNLTGHAIDDQWAINASPYILQAEDASGINQLTILNNGFFGIGNVTSPITLVDVNGDAIIRSGIQVGGTSLIKSNLNDATINFNSFEAPLYAGMTYAAQENGSFANASRYFLMFDTTNNASYPFLTNRTPNGAVVIKTGNAAGGGENEHFRINGGDGIVNAYFTNANLGIGTASPQSRLQILGPSQDVSTYGIMSFDTNTGTNDVGVKIGAVAGAGSAGYAFIQGKHTGVGNDGNLVLNPGGGNVSVGTLSSLYKLDVRTPSATTSQVHIASTDTDAGLYLTTAGDANSNFSGGAAFNGTSWVAKSTTAGILNIGASGINLFWDSGLTPGNTYSTTSRFRIDTNGNVGFGTTPTAFLGLNGDAARTIQMERGTVANAAGYGLTIKAGGATSGATNKNGGDLTLASGIATGTGYSNIYFQTATGSSVASVTVGAGGTGYVVNDVLTLAGWPLGNATVRVTSVSSGVVTGVAIVNGGSGYSIANYATTGGTGVGCIINVTGLSSGDSVPDTKMAIFGNGQVAIGTLTPPAGIRFTVQTANGPAVNLISTNQSGSGGGTGVIAYANDGAAMMSGDRLGYFILGGARDGAGTLVNATAIQSFAADNWNASSVGSYLTLETASVGNSVRAERMRINPSGNVGVGVGTGLSRLTVKGAASFTPAGTSFSVTAGQSVVIGVGTWFTQQIGIGDRITINGETKTVTAVSSDTSLTVDSNWAGSYSGSVATNYPSLFRIDDSNGAVRYVVDDFGRTDETGSYTTIGSVGYDRFHEINLTVASGGSGINSYPRAMAAFLTTSGTTDFGSSSQVVGSQGQVSLAANINAVDVAGVFGRTTFANSSPTTTSVTGIKGAVQTSSNANAIDVSGVESALNISGGTTLNTTNFYYFKGTNQNFGTLTATNFYGLYLPATSGATNNYGVYSAGGTNYFAGSLGIGALPTSKLHVVDTNIGLENVVQIYSGTTTLRNTLNANGSSAWYLSTGVAEIGKITVGTPGGNPGLTFYTGATYDQNRFDFANAGSYAGFGFSGSPIGLYITKANSFVGIGTGSAVANLHISDGNAIHSNLFSASTTNKISLISNQGATVSNYIALTANSSGSGYRGAFYGIRAGGTLGSPTVPAVNDNVVSLIGGVYDGTTVLNTGLIHMTVDGTVSTGVAPQRMEFVTTPDTMANRATRLVILSGGNVGVGTTTPTTIFHIAKDTSSGGSVQYIDGFTGSTANGANISIRTARGTASAILRTQTNDLLGMLNFRGSYAADNVSAATFENGRTAGISAIATENHTASAQGAALYFETTTNGSTTPTERMRILANGYVGVGTTSPSSVFEVSSDNNANAAGIGSLWVTGNSNKERIEIRSGSSGAPIVQGKMSGGTYVSPTATVADAGLFSIGGSGHDGSNWVVGNSSMVRIFAGGLWSGSSQPSYITFENTAINSTTRTERMRIDPSGNVGIGTTAPVSRLDILDTSTNSSAFPGGITVTQASDDIFYGLLKLQKKRATAPYTVQNGDYLGSIFFRGWNDNIAADSNGQKFDRAAQIWAKIESAPSGNDIPTQLAFATGTGTVAGTSRSMTTRMLINSYGYVGIGTTNPYGELHVATSNTGNFFRGIISSIHSDSATAGNFILMKSRGTNASPASVINGDNIGNLAFDAYVTSTGADTSDYKTRALIQSSVDGAIDASTNPITVPMNLKFVTGTSAGLERMRIASSGLISIGTTASISPLAVYSSLTNGIRGITSMQDNDGTHGAAVDYVKKRTTGGTLQVGDQIGANTYWAANNLISADQMGMGLADKYDRPVAVRALIDGTLTSTNTPGALVFLTGTGVIGGTTNPLAERMRISSVGNVGIGTSNPQSQLTVASEATVTTRGISIDQYSNNAASAILNFKKARGTIASPAIVSNGDYTGGLVFNNYTGSGSTYLANAGVASYVNGTVTASSIPTDIMFYTAAAGTTNAVADGVVRMSITSAGNVGIGNTNPGSKLDVNGDISIASGNKLLLPQTGISRNAAILNPSTIDNLALVAAYPTGGTNTGAALQVMPRGTGYSATLKAQVTVFGTDYVTDPTNYEGITLKASGTDYGLFSTKGGTGTIKPMYINATGGSTSATANMFFATDGTVGIGTTSPTSALDIKSSLAVGNNPAMQVFDTNGVARFVQRTSGIAYWQLNSGTGEAGQLAFSTPGGGVGMNFYTTDWTNRLDFANYGTYTGLSYNGVTAGGLYMLNTSGNIGIGTNSPGYVLDVQHASSKVNSKNGYLTNGADYAEYFYTNDTDLKSGETVCVDLERDNAVKRCGNSGDNNVMGIVSTNPSIVGNGNGKERDNDAHYKIIGMLGQVPAFVSDENGTIQVGDSLTAAGAPGYLRKANAGESTVGVAMQKLSSGKGSIKVLISRRNKSLTVEKVEDAVTQRIADMNIEDRITALTATANQELANQMNAKFSEMEYLSVKLQQQMEELKKMTNQDLLTAKVDLASQDIEYLKLVLGIDVDKPGNISILGKFKAENIETGVLTIAIKDEAQRTTGTNYLAPVQKDENKDGIDDETKNDGRSYVVKTGAVDENSRIYITPLGSTDNQVMYIGKITPHESFEVKVDAPVAQQVRFNWWIVQEKD